MPICFLLKRKKELRILIDEQEEHSWVDSLFFFALCAIWLNELLDVIKPSKVGLFFLNL